jgi:uncharacterized protein (DUF2345 family)
VECPGTLTIKAGKKSFVGPENLPYAFPQLPESVCIDCLLKALKSGTALASL